MGIIYDVDALKSMLYDIAELTGITLSAYDCDGNHLADCMHGSLFCIKILFNNAITFNFDSRLEVKIISVKSSPSSIYVTNFISIKILFTIFFRKISR